MSIFKLLWWAVVFFGGSKLLTIEGLGRVLLGLNVCSKGVQFEVGGLECSMLFSI